MDLIHAFPEDSRKVDKETGADMGAFWSGEKRFPQNANLDVENDLHLDYILNTANLFAFMFNLPEHRDRDGVRAIAARIAADVPEWQPKVGLKIQLEENEDKGDVTDEDVERLEALKAFFRNERFEEMKELKVADFEKDDDRNFHIDFITACSNTRAWNYRIKLASRHNVKMIAGKIIPALATTTAMITGLVELELYKYILGLPMDKFANVNVNLAVNQFQSFAPAEARKAKTEQDPIMMSEIRPIPDGFTIWDKVEIRSGDLTVEEFCRALSSAHHGVRVSLLYKYGISQKEIDEGKAQTLYNPNPYLPAAQKAKQAANSARNLRELYVEIHGPIPDTQDYLMLDGSFTDADGGDCKIPKVVYYFR